MIALTEATVKLGSTAASKEAAIAEAADLLARAGYADPGYGASMLGREKVANTFLGSGIAIPHGLLKDRELIKATGLSVVQVPNGVTWNPGETVRLVIGIAASGDEHLQVLANLTHLLADDDEIEVLAHTTDPAVVVERLTRSPDAEPSPPSPGRPAGAPDLVGFRRLDVTLELAHGLHARPATELVDVAKQFRADVRVANGPKVANAKSLASLLSLGAEGGSSLALLAQGDDADAALVALRDAIAAGLGEGDGEGAAGTVVGPPPATVPPAVAEAWTPQEGGTPVPGIAASPGIAIGPVWHLKRTNFVVARTAKDPAAEERRLRQAVEAARAELRDLRADVTARSGAGQAAIFKAHEAFLDDPELIDEAVAVIGKGHSAGWAWRDVIAQRVAVLEKVDDPLLAGRAVDMSDVGNRVVRFLAEVDEQPAALPDHPVILLADDLTPSDTAAIDPARVVGFATAAGGPTSHTAIIARALGIPAIVGAGPAILAPEVGVTAVLDGSGGSLWLDLGPADLELAEQARQDRERVRAGEHETRFEPAMTTDGYRVEVVANVNRKPEAEAAVEAGAEGVGLMRTEFLFLDRDEPPDEEQQYSALAGMVEALNGLPLIVRTLDIGGDKRAPYLGVPPEDNSFLGIRGIRLCLERPELFLPQLRAIYRASQLGPVAVMFPMISRLEDLDGALGYAEQARTEVGVEPIEVGIMVEVPSAVVLAAELARRVQFFSIGTNDLTQYVLAMDRLHPVLAKLADALHPAVLRMIKATVDAADQAGIWVGVCGGMAGEPEGALILTGLGVKELSVSVPSVAAVKARLRGVSRRDTIALAERALACTTAPEVRALTLP